MFSDSRRRIIITWTRLRTPCQDFIHLTLQRCNRVEIFAATSVMLGYNLPPLVGIGLRYLKIQMRSHRSPLRLRPCLESCQLTDHLVNEINQGLCYVKSIVSKLEVLGSIYVLRWKDQKFSFLVSIIFSFIYGHKQWWGGTSQWCPLPSLVPPALRCL